MVEVPFLVVAVAVLAYPLVFPLSRFRRRRQVRAFLEAHGGVPTTEINAPIHQLMSELRSWKPLWGKWEVHSFRSNAHRFFIVWGFNASSFWKGANHPTYLVTVPYKPAKDAWIAGSYRGGGPGARAGTVAQTVGVRVKWFQENAWESVPGTVSTILAEADRSRPPGYTHNRWVIYGGHGLMCTVLFTDRAPRPQLLPWFERMADSMRTAV